MLVNLNTEDRINLGKKLPLNKMVHLKALQN